MKLLVTGFEPWDRWGRNPSGEVARALSETGVMGCEVVSVVLPVVHGEDVSRTVPLIEAHRPAAVVSLGLGGGGALNVERVAVNLKVLDGENGEPADRPVVEGGPAAYFATLPTREMVAAIRAAGVPARLSYSAGTFLCNHIFYQVLHYLNSRGLGTPAGFIHLPPMPEQAVEGGRASMGLVHIRKGVLAALEAVVVSLRSRREQL